MRVNGILELPARQRERTKDWELGRDLWERFRERSLASGSECETRAGRDRRPGGGEAEESSFDVVTVDGSDPLEVVDAATRALEGKGAVLLEVRCGWTGLAVSAALRGMRYVGGVVGAIGSHTRPRE